MPLRRDQAVPPGFRELTRQTRRSAAMNAPAPNGPTAPPLLEVQGLVKHFPLRQGLVATLRRAAPPAVRAVDGVDFVVRRGQTLALVGESGCGKTTTGRCVLMLQRPTAGEVRFDGE